MTVTLSRMEGAEKPNDKGVVGDVHLPEHNIGSLQNKSQNSRCWRYVLCKVRLIVSFQPLTEL